MEKVTDKPQPKIKPKLKRLSQSWRKHLRRVKQEARKPSLPTR